MAAPHPVTEDQVLDALRAVRDPDHPNATAGADDVVGLGTISGLAVKDGHVAFAIEVEPARGPALEPLRQAAEAAVDALPGVLSVTAVLTAERPAGTQAPGGGPAPSRSSGAAPPPPPAAAAGRQAGPAKKSLGEGLGRIIAVASGKGGVGKSTTAVNLALGLVAEGLTVGILDADIYGPSLPRMLGIAGKPPSPDGKSLDPMEKFGLQVMSMGFLVDDETPMIWRGPMVQSALQQMLRDVNWRGLDVLVVDMPPGTGDAQLTMAQQVPLAGAVIVSTPQDIALLDARKGLNMFRKVDVPVLGIVENMSYYCCSKCGHREEIFGHGGAREEARRLGADFLGEIPLHVSIRATSDAGTPIVHADAASDHARAYRAVAERVWTKLAGATGRQAPRIVIQ